MTKRDWTGLGISLLLHAGLALLASTLTAREPPPNQLGYVEVEFGEFSPGQPVDATEEAQEETAPKAEEKTPEPEEEPEESAEEPETEQVELPDEKQTSEDKTPPEEKEAEPPQTEPKQEEDTIADQQKPSEETGEKEEGDPGEGATEQASAPYDIEGLDRDPQRAPLPTYAEQVNARIRVKITVGPDGRIIKRIPLIKGNPKLEAAVMDALQRWKFNSLPSGAPQENQTGIITFTFQLE